MKRWTRALTAVLASVCTFVPPSIAHSQRRNPVSFVTPIQNAVVHTPSQRVHALSQFELTFTLQRDRHTSQLQTFRLVLEPNHDVIAQDAVVQYVGKDGTVHSVEKIDRMEHRVFMGHAFLRHGSDTEWTNVGWARITVHKDGGRPVFEGVFRVDGNHHHVMTAEAFTRERIPGDAGLEVQGRASERMVVWKDSDLLGATQEGHGSHGGWNELRMRGETTTAAGACAADALLYNQDGKNLAYRGSDLDSAADVTPWLSHPRSLFGRQTDDVNGGNGAGVNLISTIGVTTGCPTTRKIALLGVATDCTYTAKFESNSTLRASIIQSVSSASQVYESTFNISLGIQNLTISLADCPGRAPDAAPWNLPCSNSVTVNDRLVLFSRWRGQFIDSNAFWMLMTACGTDSTVGLAWLGEVCTQGSRSDGNDTVSSANVVVRTDTEWQVIAHEIGHLFGAVHDCISTTCSDGTVSRQQCCPLSSSSCNANGAFLMNPSTSSGITHFSSCTVGNICSFLGRNSGRVSCLTNRAVNTITGSQCGNGIIEDNEDCDCGGEAGCGRNTCCDPKTCKFTTGSVCDPANEECCTSSCQLQAAGHVCRASSGACDPEETCTGNLPSCPPDSSAVDGTTCGEPNAGLQCASGQCTSRDLQCRTLMGTYTDQAGVSSSSSNTSSTHSCDLYGCQIECVNPALSLDSNASRDTCYNMQQYFLDGTQCQGGGRCASGVCNGAKAGNEVLEWLRDNKKVMIPTAVVVVVLMLLSLLSCCRSSMQRRRARRAAQSRKVMPPPGWTGESPPPLPMTGPPPGYGPRVPPRAFRYA